MARRAALRPAWSSANDEAHSAHAAGDPAVEEGPPMDFGFREIAADAEHAPPSVRSDADGGEQGCIADHAALAQLLVARVEEEIVDLAQRPAAPSSEFLIQKRGGSVDLSRRQALQADVGHHLGRSVGGEVLHVLFSVRQKHGARVSATALQRLWVEATEA